MSESSSATGQRWLDSVERAGNALPHPTVLFALGLALVMLLSQLAAWLGWSVQMPSGAGQEGETVVARGLLESDGLWWLFSSLVENFVRFPPLGLVLVTMLGIGVADRSGLLPVMLERMLRLTPDRLLSPAVVLLGILSSVTLDAGYVVLPPLAAALFHAAGRSPLAGLAAAFAGVSAGFGANLMITVLDPMLAGLTESGARILDPDYSVAVTANWWLMIVSTFVLTGVGWWVTARLVEPRQAQQPIAEDVIAEGDEQNVGQHPGRGLRAAGLTFALTMAALLMMILIPGAPLQGQGEVFQRWIEAMVPLLLLIFLLPGLAYGFAAGTLRSNHDVARMLGETIAGLAPYIVLAFVAAQFIEAFSYSQLGLLLAITGGQALAALTIPTFVLAVGFLLVAMLANLFIGSASAKYAFLAPVFVPMLMQAGLSPELTQAAYRIGDSVTNIITPLNPYWVIVLAFVQRWRPQAGLGTLLALMLPYALAFALVWPLLLALWILLGLPPGPGAAVVVG
ncbi:MAG: AbgT family transporter [Oleiphilaceae bacterium]|nr:AbgT family transporter [Oleiphilaceae bacterium]